jgi:hypothetical protein
MAELILKIWAGIDENGAVVDNGGFDCGSVNGIIRQIIEGAAIG